MSSTESTKVLTRYPRTPQTVLKHLKTDRFVSHHEAVQHLPPAQNLSFAVWALCDPLVALEYNKDLARVNLVWRYSQSCVVLVSSYSRPLSDQYLTNFCLSPSPARNFFGWASGLSREKSKENSRNTRGQLHERQKLGRSWSGRSPKKVTLLPLFGWPSAQLREFFGTCSRHVRDMFGYASTRLRHGFGCASSPSRRAAEQQSKHSRRRGDLGTTQGRKIPKQNPKAARRTSCFYLILNANRTVIEFSILFLIV